MDFVSKIVSGNIDRIKRNISNSFVQDLDVEKGFDDELEKGKWNVGDQKFFNGNMHYVAELKPDGSPRWRRVKKNSGGSNSSSAANLAPSQNNTPTSIAQKNSSVKSDKKIVNNVLDAFKDNPLYSKKKIEKLVSKHISESKEFLSFKFPAAGSSKISKNVDEKTYDLNGSKIILQVDRNRSYNTEAHYNVYLSEYGRIATSQIRTSTKQNYSHVEAKKDCLHFALVKYLSIKYNYDISK